MSLPISVLMSTYFRETAANLSVALESLYAQTEPPAEIVLVVDGPVQVDQDEVIAGFANDQRIARLTVLRLPECRGLALALNVGLLRCTAPFIARMDSDDICFPDRLATQWHYLEQHPELDVIGSWSAEFRDDPTIVTGLKTPPQQHDEIVRALSWRNILIHPSILVRKRALEKISGYRSLFGDYADYDLYVRLILVGARFHMIQRPLIKYRTSLAQRRRRSGIRYVVDEVNFRVFCYRSGFISVPQFLFITPLYCIFRLMPPSVKEYLYRFVRTQPLSPQ